MIKKLLRELCMFLKLDISQNIKYDRLTLEIIKKYISKDDNCMDIGCHKGEILDEFLKQAPNGKHFAFEPIPEMYKALVNSYKNKAELFPFALSNTNGTTTFNYVKNAPAYSGINKRKYAVSEPDIQELTVEQKRIDDIISETEKIDFVKIDVEGGEFDVIKGGEKTFVRNAPIIIFEFGKGASEFYGTSASEFFDFLNKNLNQKIYTLSEAVKDNKTALTKDGFMGLYEDNSEYYFIAIP